MVSPNIVRLVGGLLIFGGESLAIYQEMLVARAAKLSGLSPKLGLWLFIWMAISGGLLLAGYFLGYLSFHNIWIVTVISIGSILIAEPLLIMLLFNEAPTLGAWIGLGCAVLGIASAIIF